MAKEPPRVQCWCASLFIFLFDKWTKESSLTVTSHCPCSVSTRLCTPPPPSCQSQAEGAGARVIQSRMDSAHHPALFGIHATLSPPPAAMNIDSLKETSHCHFNSCSLSLPLSSLHFPLFPAHFFLIPFCLFLPFLPCGLPPTF